MLGSQWWEVTGSTGWPWQVLPQPQRICERSVTHITSAGGCGEQGGTLEREVCVGKPSSCHAVGVLKVSHLCDLLARAQLWDWGAVQWGRGLWDPLSQPCG